MAEHKRTPRILSKQTLFYIVCTGTIVFLLASLTSSLASAASWPSTKFEVFEGEPWNSQDTIALGAKKIVHSVFELDEPKPASVPLTHELRYEIEEYLGEVAREYQKYFPSPRLEPLVERGDGVQAYRIYYFDFPEASLGFARFANNCSESIRFRIEVNAATLTSGGKITPKGYGDLAHELFHAIQRSTTAGKKSACPDGIGPWAIEGQAEAIGHDMARRLRRTEIDSHISRWGLRYYSLPLVFAPKNRKELKELKDRAYQTSSFWRYIAEMQYLKSRGKRDADAKPGPDLSGGYDTDYSYLADLMSREPVGTGEKAEAKWLNEWVHNYFGVDLSRTYIDFVSVYAQYGKYRIDSNKVPDAERDWREIGFGASKDMKRRGCETVRLDEKNDNVSVRLSLQKLAAECVEFDVGDTGTPLSWVLQAIGKDKASLKQLRLAMAGGQQIATSAPIDDIPNASGAVGVWNFLLDPGKKQYLLVANMAKEAQNTVPQEIELRVTLSSRNDNHVPQRKKSTAGNTPSHIARPGPAGASQTRARRNAEMVGAFKGAGATTWDLTEAYGNCSGRRAKADCQSEVTLKLGSSSVGQFMPGTSSATAIGGMHGQLMEMVNVDKDALMTGIKFEGQNPGTKVIIKAPGFDYGFTGTINGASILVSGANDSDWLRSMSTTPEDKYPPCLYRQPTGTLSIEEFTPYILRGSYSGQLVKGEVVRNVRKCPTKDIVDSISGSFVIAAPWTQDSRRDIDVSWLQEDAYNDINQMLPASMIATDPGLPGGPPSFEGSDIAVSADAADEPGLNDCDCSCESIRKAMKITQQGMTGRQPDAAEINMMMCMGQCMAGNPNDCSLD